MPNAHHGGGSVSVLAAAQPGVAAVAARVKATQRQPRWRQRRVVVVVVVALVALAAAGAGETPQPHCSTRAHPCSFTTLCGCSGPSRRETSWRARQGGCYYYTSCNRGCYYYTSCNRGFHTPVLLEELRQRREVAATITPVSAQHDGTNRGSQGQLLGCVGA